MITLSEFRELCATDKAEDIVDNILLRDDAKHVSVDNREYLLRGLAAAYGVDRASIQLWIVGSAKLGFSISEKRKPDGRVLPRYRPFSVHSDIDTAVVCPDLFRLIWDELCIYAHGQPWMPWSYKQLGDYMVYGWLRPDHFPPRVRRCDDWWDLFRRFSANPRFGRRSVRGALFHSVSDLRRYQRRAVIECINAEMEQA